VAFCWHGSLNVPIEHHPTIRYMVYNGYYKVMSNIPKMGQLPTPVLTHHFSHFWVHVVLEWHRLACLAIQEDGNQAQSGVVQPIFWDRYPNSRKMVMSTQLNKLYITKLIRVVSSAKSC
jgi:hypothetical protein